MSQLNGWTKRMAAMMVTVAVVSALMTGCADTGKGKGTQSSESDQLPPPHSSQPASNNAGLSKGEEENKQAGFAEDKDAAEYLAKNKTEEELKALDTENQFDANELVYDDAKISLPKEYDASIIAGSRWYRGEVVGLTNESIVLAQLSNGPDYGASRYEVNRVVANKAMKGTDTTVAEVKMGDYFDVFYDGMMITGAKNFGPINKCIVYIQVDEVTTDAAGVMTIRGNDGTVEVIAEKDTKILETISEKGEFEIPATLQELMNKSFVMRIEEGSLMGDCLRGRVREIWR